MAHDQLPSGRRGAPVPGPPLALLAIADCLSSRTNPDCVEWDDWWYIQLASRSGERLDRRIIALGAVAGPSDHRADDC